MIKVEDLEFEGHGNEGESYVKANLIADTKEEVIEMGNRPKNVEGLNDEMVVLTLGSRCITVNFEIGMLNSDGQWNFV